MGKMQKSGRTESSHRKTIGFDGVSATIILKACDGGPGSRQQDNLENKHITEFFHFNTGNYFTGDLANAFEIQKFFLKCIKINKYTCVHWSYFGPAAAFYFVAKMMAWLSPWINFEKEEVSFDTLSDKYIYKKLSTFVMSLDFNSNQIIYPEKFDNCNFEECANSRISTKIEINSNTLDVVIPTKGVSDRELQRCIKSVSQQLSGDDRIILVDDNETRTINYNVILKTYPNTLVLSGDNKGVAQARNKGLEQTRDGLVAFIDSDDYVLPGYFELQKKFLQNNHNVAASCTWLRAFGRHKVVYPQWDNFSPQSILACLPAAGVLFWKKDALTKLSGFDNGFINGFEDFDLVARATASGFQIATLDIPLYMYQRGQTSLSQSWRQKEELKLRSLVNSNVLQLCPHKAAETFEIISDFYGLAFTSRLDLYHNSNLSFWAKKVFRKHLPRFRNSRFFLTVWRSLPMKLRSSIYKNLLS